MDYLARNRAHWTRSHAEWTGPNARRAWSRGEIRWGVWGHREADLRTLPDVNGLDVIELGCGTAYLAAALKRAGARSVVGVDLTPAQLGTAHELSREHGLEVGLVQANAESLPIASATFDLAVSEYGASIWCDPSLWIPEAARVLRPGGELVFMRNSTLSVLCTPADGALGERLTRSQRDLGRLDWDDDQSPSTEFQLGHGDLLRLLRRSGFEVLDLHELYAPADAEDHPRYSYVPAAWAREWPAEEIWCARRTAADRPVDPCDAPARDGSRRRRHVL